MDICNYVLLVGFGCVGSLLGEKLLVVGILLVVIEMFCICVDELCECGICVVLGNVVNEEIMNLVYLDCVCWLLLIIFNGYEVGEIVVLVWEKSFDIEIIVCVYYDDEVKYIIEWGVN